MFNQLKDFGWADFDHGSSAVCPMVLRQMGLAEMAEQVGKKKKHQNSKSTQPKSASCLNTLYKTSHLSSAVRFILVSIGDSVEHELIM